MGIRLLSGRGLDRADVDRSEPIAVVNHALVNAYFPNQDPIGARLAPALPPRRSENPEDPRWLTIVGVVSDTPVMALGETNPLPMMYIPMSVAGGPDMSLAGRAQRRDDELCRPLSDRRRARKRCFPQCAVRSIRSMRIWRSPRCAPCRTRSTAPRREWPSPWSCSPSPRPRPCCSA